ncbi:MAG: hypothetical protein AAB681_03120 [Patescibacteria group bacterium]
MKKRIVAGIVLPIAFFTSYSSSVLAAELPLNAPTTEYAVKMSRRAIRNDTKRLKENKIALREALKVMDEKSIGGTIAEVDIYKKKLRSDTLALRRINKITRN